MENRLRWYGDVQQKFEKVLIRKGSLICVEISKKIRGRIKLIWLEIVGKDVKKLGITSAIVLDRNSWRMRDHKVNPNSLKKVR